MHIRHYIDECEQVLLSEGPESALECYRRAAETYGALGETGWALLARLKFACTLREFGRADERALPATRYLEDLNDPDEAWSIQLRREIVSIQGLLYMQDRDYGRAESCFGAAATMPTVVEDDRDLASRINAILLQHTCRARVAAGNLEDFDFAEAIECCKRVYDEVAAQLTARGDLYACGVLAILHLSIERSREALIWGRKVCDIARNGAADVDVSDRYFSVLQLALASWQRGELSLTRPLVALLLDMQDDACLPIIPTFRTLVATIALIATDPPDAGEADRLFRAIEELDDLLDDSRSFVNPAYVCTARVTIGEFFKHRGDTGRAQRHFQEAARIIVDANQPIDANRRADCAWCVACWAREQGDLSGATELLNCIDDILGGQEDHISDTTLVSYKQELGRCQYAAGERSSSLRTFVECRDLVEHLLAKCPTAERMKVLLTVSADVCRYGQAASRQLFQSEGDPSFLGELLMFYDVHKAAVVRAGLCFTLHSNLSRADYLPRVDNWSSGPRKLDDAFEEVSGVSSSRTETTRRIRGGLPPEPVIETNERHFAFDTARAEVIELSTPVTTEHICESLSERQAVLMYYFEDDSLIVLPAFGGTSFSIGKPIEVRNARPQLEQLLDQQCAYLRIVLDSADGLKHQKLSKLGFVGHDAFQREICTPLDKLLGFAQLRNLLGQEWHRMDLTLIPTDILFQLPLHAAYCKEEGYLYEQVNSLNYAMSLQTLVLQDRLERNPHWNLQHPTSFQGTIFANPDRDGLSIPGCISEVNGILEETGKAHWRVFGDRAPHCASSSNVLAWSQLGGVLWFMGHGGDMNDNVETTDGRVISVCRPSVLLTDGPMSDTRMFAAGMDLRRTPLVHFSCCTLGRLSEDQCSYDLEGWVGSLALMGARRVTSALWPLVDEAAANFARHWIKALRKRVFESVWQPRAYSMAFKEAITSFRYANGREYDHELYWAPYIMYGSG